MRSLTAKVFLITLLLAATAFSQDFNFYGFTQFNYSFIGSGAKARAMGGAFTGIADDASALTWNPAGLVQVDKIQASIAGSFVPLSVKTGMTFGNSPAQNFSSTFSDHKLKTSYGSFVAPVRIKGHPFMASMAYQGAQDDIEHGTSADSVLELIVTRSLVAVIVPLEHRTTYRTGGLDNLRLGFGTGVYGNLSIGGAVNIYSGSNAAGYNSVGLDTVPFYVGQDITDSVRIKVSYDVNDTSNSKGYNLTGSLFYKMEKLRLGISISSPFQITTKHTIFRADSIFTRTMHVTGEGTPTAILPTIYTGKTKMDIPMLVAGGVSYKVTPQLTLAIDGQYQQFSKAKYYVRLEGRPTTPSVQDLINQFVLPGSMYYDDSSATTYVNGNGETVEVYNSYDLKLYNSVQIRLGGEYVLKTKAGEVPIRAGFRRAQLPTRDVSNLTRDIYTHPKEGFILGDRVTQSVFTFGTGVHWRQIWLDGAVEVTSQKQTLTGVNGYGSFSTEQKRDMATFSLNFTGFF